MTLKFYTSVAKGSKLKVRKFWGVSPMFAEVTSFFTKNKTTSFIGFNFFSESSRSSFDVNIMPCVYWASIFSFKITELTK